MTTIDRLGLTGIRSYGAEQETFIRFYRPLTIILGRNGSGKSTIIEAVKMATTGDLPPMVEKGAAFIHDPRIDNETETKAKIRLQFTNARGDNYVVSRHFSLSIKRGVRGAKYKTEFKTLDQTLKRSTGDGPASTSTFRCGDLNAMLPEIMRVTKPILNNVIFVHQEESLWPLGDPKKLKEKFDDIFASTRYTKALEAIRKFRKEQAVDLRVLNADLARFEEKVQVLDKLRLQRETMRADQDKLRRGMKLVQSELDELNRQVEEARLVEEKYEKAKDDLRNLERDVKGIEESQKTLESRMSIHIKDMDDAGLRSEFERLNERLRSIDGERLERSRAINDLQSKQERKHDELVRRQTRRGALEQNELLHKKDLNLLEAMKKSFHDENFLRSAIIGGEITNDTRMESRNLPSSDSSLEEWSVALGQLMRDMERSVMRMKTAKDRILKEAMSSVNQADINMKTTKNSITVKKETRKNQGKLLQQTRLEIQGMGDAQTRFKESKEREAVAREVYEGKRASTTIADLQKEKEKMSNEFAAAQKQLDDIRTVRDGLMKDQELRTELEVCKEAVLRTEREVGTGLEMLCDKLVLAQREVQDAEKLVPNYVASENCISLETLRSADFGNPQTRGRRQEELIEACHSTSFRKDSLVSYLEKRVADLKSKVSSARAREGVLKMQTEDAETKVRSQEVVLGGARKELLNAPRVDESPDVEDLMALFQKALVVADESGCGISAQQIELVDRTVKRVDHEVAAAQQRSSLSFAYARFAQDDLDKFESSPKHVCPTCGLSSAKKVDSMRKRMQEKVSRHKNPNEQAKEEDIIRKLQRTSVALKKVRNEGSALVSFVATYVPASKDLEEAAAVAQDGEKSLREMTELMGRVQELVGRDSAVGELEERRSEVVRLAGTLERNLGELTAAKDNLPPSSHGEHSMNEVNAQMSSVEQRITQIQDDLNKISKSIDRERESVDHANKRLHNAIETRGRLQDKAAECARKEEEKERLIASNRALDEEIETLQDNLAGLISAHNDALLTYGTVAAEQERLEYDANRTFGDAREKVSEWDALMQKVRTYSSSTTKNELGFLMMSITGLDEDIKVIKQDIAALQQEAQTSSNSEHGIRLSMANIESNMAHRANDQKIRIAKRSMRHLQDDIDRLRAQVDGGDPRAHVKTIEAKINDCLTSFGATQGKLQQITELYKLKRTEFVEAERDGSRRLYDECRIQKQTIELASTDLDRYHRALDQALMAFHTLKMNSINRIIKELWQQTYRGTDIDEIEITSDAGEALGSGVSSNARRNYNYRVMMRQGQAQLDMRGRCSAGQKVLACLVIRLALAESFCTDCGILALDEPTTNLDHENIESLAFALKSIIEHRRKQRNFQLVLITHDREFIEMIGARDFANEFFMVYKDSDGISHAKVQDLNQLPE